MALSVKNMLGGGGKSESIYAFNKYEPYTAYKIVDGEAVTTTGQRILTSTVQGTITYKQCTDITVDNDGRIIPVGDYTEGSIVYNASLNTTGIDYIYILETSVGIFAFKTYYGGSSLKIYNDNQGVWISRSSSSTLYNYTLLNVNRYTDYRFISVIITKTPYDYRHGEVNDDGYFYTHSLSRFDSKETIMYTSDNLNVGDNVSLVTSATKFKYNNTMVTQYYKAYAVNRIKLDDTHYIIQGYYSDNYYTFYLVVEVVNDTLTVLSNGTFGDSYYNFMLGVHHGDKLLFINGNVSYFYAYYYKLNEDYTLELIVRKYNVGLSAVYASVFSDMFVLDDTHIMFVLSDTIAYKMHFITMTLSETDYVAVDNPIEYNTQANCEQLLCCDMIGENRWIFYTNQWKSNRQYIRTFTLNASFAPVLSDVIYSKYNSSTFYSNRHKAINFGDGNIGFFENSSDTVIRYYTLNVDNFETLFYQDISCPFSNLSPRDLPHPNLFTDIEPYKLMSYYAYETGASSYRVVFSLVKPELDGLKIIDSFYLTLSTYANPHPIVSASGLHVVSQENGSYLRNMFISKVYTLVKDVNGSGVAILSANRFTKCLATI